ncbi:hypothetical protein L7F22_037649 [Adiantum nelumboides]|nr:hypothetical protein [Adiantum nelumboides]
MIAGPLHDLTKNKTKYVWTPKENTAFMQLKAKLMTQPLLVLPDLKKLFEVHCDACGDSIGAVLSQEGHPIAYESRRLNSQERDLGVYEKELISVIHALQSWKHYLLGTTFVIYIDHQSIRCFMTQTKLSEKQMRWANFLSQFHFHIAHVAGKKNQVANALSRRPRINAVSIAYNHDLTSMIGKYAEDSDYQGIMQGLAQGRVIEPYSLKEGFLLYENRLCVTKDMRGKVMGESHEPPYADGQSEIANSIVLDLLKSYVGEVAQSNQWEKYLPLVEYAYNNTIHTSTSKTPFEVIEGRPRLPLILKPHEKIFAADEEVRDIRVAFDKIKESIQYAQQKYKRAAHKHRKSSQFKDGDWVLLRFTKARLKTTTGKNWKGEPTGHQKYYMKIAKRYYGPFQVLSRINEMAYKLRLPANWHIHNAFHVSLLKPFKGDPPIEPVQEEPPLFDDKEEVLQPEEILRHEENILRSGKVIRRYLVKFKHYSNEDSKWMQETQMKDVLPLLQDYKTLHGLM